MGELIQPTAGDGLEVDSLATSGVRSQADSPADDAMTGARSQADPDMPAAVPPASRSSPPRVPDASACAPAGSSVLASPRSSSCGGEIEPDGSSVPGLSVAPPGSPTATPSPEPQRPTTRSQRGIVKPKKFTDGTIRYGNLCSTGEPQSLQEALGDSNWKKAMMRNTLLF